MWLLVLALISVAVYAADTFTAVNLVAFDRWSSQVQPAVPFEVSKWIFFGCICFSWALAALEWLRAIRVIRGGGVADSYLDPLAAVIQSMRLGKGQGWRRFLVFAELTTSKKGTDYIALFVYFQFKGTLNELGTNSRSCRANMTSRCHSNHLRRRPPSGHQCRHSVFRHEAPTNPRRQACRI